MLLPIYLSLIFLAIIQGLTEWLPVSSSGILIILEETIKIVKYVEKKECDYGKVKFEEFVADFIKSKDGGWVFINCKAFKLEENCYEHIRKKIKIIVHPIFDGKVIF